MTTDGRVLKRVAANAAVGSGHSSYSALKTKAILFRLKTLKWTCESVRPRPKLCGFIQTDKGVMKDFAEANADVYERLVSNAVFSSACWKRLLAWSCFVSYCPRRCEFSSLLQKAHCLVFDVWKFMTYFEYSLCLWTVCWWWARTRSSICRQICGKPVHTHIKSDCSESGCSSPYIA